MHWKKTLIKIYVHTLAVILLFLMNQGSGQAQNGPACDTYTNIAAGIPTGLGSNTVNGVYVSGDTIYAATNGGLSISTDGGASFTNKTTTNGLGDNVVKGIYVSGGKVYAATNVGLSISNNGGATFTNKTTTDGLGNNIVLGVYVSGSKVYAATAGGLSISTDGGASFTNKTTTNGLGNIQVLGVYASGNNVYAATRSGLSVSTNSGTSFTNRTTALGLGNNLVTGVYVSGGIVYAATRGGLSISTNGTNFTNKTTTNGLGSNIVLGVYVSGSTVYAATFGGLSISTDGGTSFTNKTTTNGLGNNNIYGVYASGSTVYAATTGGLSVSTDGGNTFTNTAITTPLNNGLGDNTVNGFYQSGNTLYVATAGGLSISTDGGITYTNKTTTSGLGNNVVNSVYVSGGTIYAANQNGLSISADGGTTFTNHFFGTGDGSVKSVYVSGSTIIVGTSSFLQKSTDGGATYTQIDAFSGLASIPGGGNIGYKIFGSGNMVYAAMTGGLAISSDGGNNYSNKTTSNGLGSNTVYSVYASGNNIYAATAGGLSISTDGGETFTNKTTSNGLGDNTVNGVYALGSTVYAATAGGLSISTDGGATFINYTSTNGLGSNAVKDVYVSGRKIYAATTGGVSFCSQACTPTTSIDTVAACGSYNWHGTNYTSSNNTATWVTTNAGGCDSTVTLHLTINQATTSTTSISNCVSYSWNGQTYTTSGTYTWTGTNAAGCDSVATLNLIIKQATTSTTNISNCVSYNWNGQTYTTSGTYTWTGTNAAGCDSVATLNLIIKQATTSTTTQTATGSYTWNGNSYTSSGTYTYHATNAVGCDSTATLNLTINAVVINNISNVCAYIGTNQTLTYTANVAGASSYAWTLPANTQLVSGQGTRTIGIKILNGFASQANKQIKVTPAGGSLQIIYLLAQAPVTPASITASSSSVCASIGTGVPITYTIPRVYEQSSNGATAASYIWAAQNGTTNIVHPNGSGVNDTTVAVTFTSGFTSSNITVQAVNDCGVSGSRSLTISKDAPPQPGLISGPANPCENIGETGQLATYSISAIDNVSSYTWSLPNGAFAVTGQGSNSISFKYPAGFTSGTIAVTATNGCGTGSARTLSVSKLQAGIPSIIDIINTSACPNRSYSYTLSAMPSNATSVQWTVPTGGTIVSGQGTTSITVAYANTVINGEVKAQAVNNCSVSGNRTASVKLAACPASGFASNKVVNTLSSDGLSVKAFPNPTTSSFNLQVITADSKEVKVKIMDVQGRMIKSLIVVPYETTNIGNDLKAGVYMVETRQGGEVKTVRVVKY